MTASNKEREDADSSALMTLIRAIASRDPQRAARLIEAAPDLARLAVEVGATRDVSTDYYFKEIEHYVYGGDTALHIAAAAYQREIAEKLLGRGAKVGARNRRGAEPLHYAADGIPGSPGWDPAAQEAIIQLLIRSGADPNATDKSGVAPIHRAVRTRCSSAVRALLTNGAQVRLTNKSGSTPLHLAVQDTGRGGSGSPAAREGQTEIIRLLIRHGARPSDKDAAGRSVMDSARIDWVRALLDARPTL